MCNFCIMLTAYFILISLMICDTIYVLFQLKGFAQSELLAHLYSSRDQARSFTNYVLLRCKTILIIML